MVKLSTLRQHYKNLYTDITDIDILITDTLKIDKSKLFLDLSVSDEDEQIIKEKVARLTLGEPVSYIIGFKEFMSLDFAVNSSTLIPRADTEILVEELLKLFRGKAPLIFEVGTGSGCIAISLAHYLENAKIIACDISEDALKIARLNAEANGVSDRISFIRHDILKGFPDLKETIDCVVSNPPYIESEVIKTLDRAVRDFEPLSALDGGSDGLDFYRKIIAENPLKKGGVLAFEIGYNQGNAVFELMRNDFEEIKIIKDLSGNDRVVLGIKK